MDKIFGKGRTWLIGVIILVIILAGGYAFLRGGILGIGTIKIGGIFDMTGGTADVGVDYSLGVKDAARWINDHRGIKGKKIELISNDYGYKVERATKLYKNYTEGYKVQMIQGWGTADSDALRPEVNKDGVVYMSASYSASLSDPFHTPYNFFVGTDYSTSLRLAIKYISDVSKPAKVVFMYPNVPYGTAPIAAGKRMASDFGVSYGPDQVVALDVKDATEQLQEVKKYNPDWIWLGGTTSSCAVVIRDAGKIGLDTKFMINVWGFDETLFEKAGSYAEGRTYGVIPFAMWGENVPGMADIMEAHQRYKSAKTHTLQYVKGWVSMMVMAEGLKRTSGSPTGPKLKNALETVDNFDTKGLTAPITFTSRDHRPNMKLKIYKIGDGKCVPVKDVEMERDSRFLGW
jgi:branched-chain amino acid transport system substrate-binding protein